MHQVVPGEPGGRHARRPRSWRSRAAEAVTAVVLLGAVGSFVSGTESLVRLVQGRPNVVIVVDPGRQLAEAFDTAGDSARRFVEWLSTTAATLSGEDRPAKR